MFRRKTDQVYATLQQVQRRLTQQTADDEADAAQARSRAAGTPPEPRPQSMPPPAFSMPSAVSSPTLPTGAQVPAPGISPSQRRHVLQLSGELATILFLLWLVTLVATFFVGQYFGKRGVAPDDPGAGYATGEAGTRAPRSEAPSEQAPAIKAPAVGQPGGHILVLASVARANSDDEQRFSNDAKRLNQFAEQNARSGYRPWFGVRKPSSGGLQLVFGLVNGQFGVDKEPFAAFADALDRAGYKGAHWVRVADK